MTLDKSTVLKPAKSGCVCVCVCDVEVCEWDVCDAGMCDDPLPL